MGFPGKQQHPQSDGCLESEGKKWVIARISIRSTTLKPIITKSANRDRDEEDESCSTTPTSADAMILEKLLCPPAPRKRRPVKCNNFLGVREFFNPPDLETVFIRHVERAN